MKTTRTKRILAVFLSFFFMFAGIWTFELKTRAAVTESGVGVYYYTHIQGIGDESIKFDGQMAGTKGQSRRLEAIHISLGDASGSGAPYTGNLDLGVQYTTHCQTYGWLPWSANGEMNGTKGESKRLEAIKIQLTGADSGLFDIYYRVHAQTFGWLAWAKNGEPSGTAGQSKRLEGIQIVIVKAGEKPADDLDGIVSANSRAYVANAGLQPVVGFDATDSQNPQIGNAQTPIVTYQTHVQSYGWQAWKANGQMSGTKGESKRLEGIKIRVTNLKSNGGGIQYITHVQTYGWQGDENDRNTWQKDGAMAGTSGESKRLESIRIALYGDISQHYDVYYRVHAQSYGWLGWAKNGEPSGTAGGAKRLEAIQIVLVEKNGETPSADFGGYAANRPEPFIEAGDNSSPQPEVPLTPGGDSDQTTCSHKVLGTYDGVTIAQAYLTSYGKTKTDVANAVYTSSNNANDFGSVETAYTLYLSGRLDTQYLYFLYNGDDGYRDISDGNIQYFPNYADPVARAGVSCDDDPYGLWYLSGDNSIYDDIAVRYDYMKAQGYTNVLSIGFTSVNNQEESFDLYYKNQKVATFQTVPVEGKPSRGTGLYGFDYTKSIYTEISGYKPNMTTDELIDAGMYWIAKHTYDEYDCWSCKVVANVMKMKGLPACTISTSAGSGYPPYVAISPKVELKAGNFHAASIIFTDKTHYTIVEVQGRYGRGCPDTWAEICQPHKISYDNTWYGSTKNMDVRKNVPFLDGYSSVYDMMKDCYGIDITTFDPFDCNTWW